jgi:hypothetical protein
MPNRQKATRRVSEGKECHVSAEIRPSLTLRVIASSGISILSDLAADWVRQHLGIA